MLIIISRCIFKFFVKEWSSIGATASLMHPLPEDRVIVTFFRLFSRFVHITRSVNGSFAPSVSNCPRVSEPVCQVPPASIDILLQLTLLVSRITKATNKTILIKWSSLKILFFSLRLSVKKKMFFNKTDIDVFITVCYFFTLSNLKIPLLFGWLWRRPRFFLSLISEDFSSTFCN